MPHVVVKMYAGKSDQQKSAIAEAITQAVMTAGHYGEGSISVSLEDVAARDWVEKVFKPGILDRPDILYKKPGYDPL